MSTKVIFDKSLLEKTIILLPQENAYDKKKSKLEQSFEVRVTAIGRTKIDCAQIAGRNTITGHYFRQEPRSRIFNHYNYSYLAFPSWDALKRYLHAEEVQDRLRNTSEPLTEAQLLQVGQVLGWLPETVEGGGCI